MSKIKQIVVHCSDSSFGNVLLIDKWHKERGFRMVGYNYLVLNGFPTSKQLKSKQCWTFLDGSVECGRDLDTDTNLEGNEVGAHAYGFNRSSVGVCLIGKNGFFTPRQLFSLRCLLNELRSQFNLPLEAIVGHYELNPGKTCPDMNMDYLRQYLEDYNKVVLLLKNYWGNLT